MHRQRMGDPLEQTRSGLVVASSVDSNAGDKRHLENNDESASNRSGPQIIILSPQRQGKTIRRDYNINIASPKGMEVETVAPVRGFLDENGGEGDIDDHEMDVPTSSSTSLLGRSSDVHAADPFRSIPSATSSTAGGSGRLPTHMNPALMVKIDTLGMSTTSNSSIHPASTPFPSPAKQPKQNGISNSSGPSMPFPKPMAEFKRQLVENGDTADVTMRDFEEPRLKGVIGRSGNQITVNGVTILTGKGHGEQQVDEAGQRELVGVIVDLHNKGISTAEMTRLVNKVMTALAKPTPSHDPRFITRSANASSVAPATVTSSAHRENAALASTVLVNSRRPSAADFMDLPPSRLASSHFFRSNASRAFAPPHPKQLVVELNHSFDECSGSDVESDSDFKTSTSTAGGFDQADAPRQVQSDEMRIVGEGTLVAALERGARLATYAAAKKAVAADSAATDSSSPATKQSASGARPRLSAKCWASPIHAKPSLHANGFNASTASATSESAKAQLAGTGLDISTVEVKEGVKSGAKPAPLDGIPAATDSGTTEAPPTTTACLAPPSQNDEPIPPLAAVTSESQHSSEAPSEPRITASTDKQAADSPAIISAASTLSGQGSVSGDVPPNADEQEPKKKQFGEQKTAKIAARKAEYEGHKAAGTLGIYFDAKEAKRAAEQGAADRAAAEQEAANRAAAAAAAVAANRNRASRHRDRSGNGAHASVDTRQAPGSEWPAARPRYDAVIDPATNAVSASSTANRGPTFRQGNAGRERNGPAASVARQNGPPRAVSAQFAKNTAPGFRPANGGHGWNGHSTSVARLSQPSRAVSAQPAQPPAEPSPMFRQANPVRGGNGPSSYVASTNVSPPINSLATSNHARPAASTAPNAWRDNKSGRGGRGGNRGRRREG